ncbi:MAG: metal ABC transporter substrate-binding protein [Magnetococcus sp. DMHC-8]
MSRQYNRTGRRPGWLLLSWFWSLFLWTPATAREPPPIRVVTSFSILADLVQQVGGQAVTVKSLVGPDGDAHVYEPLPADAIALRDASMCVINGLGFEGWIERLIKASAFKGVLVTASTGIHPLPLHGRPGDGHGQAGETVDPHAWHDLANVPVYIARIAEGLTRIDPTRADLFQNNAHRYGQAVQALDQWIRETLAAIPTARRKVISSHNAFGYFTRAYGIAFLAPVGVSSDAEPSAGQVARLISQIKQEKIKAIFLENMSNPRLARQLIKESGAVLGGTLYTDALSTAEGPAPSFLAMVRHNVMLLRKAMADP